MPIHGDIHSQPLSGTVEINVAPHSDLWPWNATGAPSMSTFGFPSPIALTPWPGIGQEQRSPLRATALPITVLFGAAEITLPP